MTQLLRPPEPREGEAVSPEDGGRRRPGLEEHLVSLIDPASFPAEQYRVLQHFIEQLHKEADLRMLAVASPAAGDGKTTTAINVAGTLAQVPDTRVLLVDADLRRGTVRNHLGLSGSGEAGLADTILNARLALGDVVRRRPDFNLFVLPAGRCPAVSYEVLNSPRVPGLLQEMRGQYDYIVLDTPPLLAVPDGRVIARWVDGILMVVAAHKTPRRLVEEALDVVDPAKLVGVVFNGDDRMPAASYGYDRYYGTGAGRRRAWRGWWRGGAKGVRG